MHLEPHPARGCPGGTPCPPSAAPGRRGARTAPPPRTRGRRYDGASWDALVRRTCPGHRGAILPEAVGGGQTVSSPAQPPVEGFVARHDDLGGEELSRAGPCGFTQGSPSGRVVDQALQRAGERAGVTGGDQYRARVVL